MRNADPGYADIGAQTLGKHQGGGKELFKSFCEGDEGFATHAKTMAQGAATQVWVRGTLGFACTGKLGKLTRVDRLPSPPSWRGKVDGTSMTCRW